MVILLIASVLLFSLIAVAIYLWQRPPGTVETMELPAREARSLFDNPSEVSAPEVVNDQNHLADEILARAEAGEKESLNQANSLDPALYESCLNSLLKLCENDRQLLSLLSYVVRHDLPVNQNLATAFIASWQNSPDRSNTAKMLHAAALSNDADTYRKAVELTLSQWREGKLATISATELQALFGSEFWVLSSSTRSSGAGFLLKRTLASAQRELSDLATD